MKNNLDRVNEAYYGEMGEYMKSKTIKRINWILNHVVGEKVLDVGCSQGIIDILLARKGIHVTAVDIEKEAIQYAKKELSKEKQSTREKVELIHANYLHYDVNRKFNCILLTEILEHFEESSLIIKKVYKMLSKGGRVIVTIPFGINEHPGHLRTLYLAELYKELYPYMKIQKVEMIESWIGLICERKIEVEENVDVSIPIKLVEEIEKGFFKKERKLLDQLNYQKKLNDSKET
ncbi:methyltransferase domain-containing protein (plasmid) [Cytobacillus spongiae]|uniref:class I SAM-dependent methyltransferase n=1 Tax=Cytobacillus spongiae TaxID=2901381 RepID=UPI00145FBBDE|nr:methyltransferase domain-containing protein [Cytobacillus spongiae]NMH71105.1 methyltransferase domain-containing protein [Bacillus sp. RO3]UII58047.1 methyltransferase domain-containing protein [Cytobacillus spongiae]